MKKVYYLSTCNTCKNIMNELDLSDFNLQDIKSQPITENQLEELYHITQSYEVLFSKRAQLYRKLGLNEKSLSESDFKNYILEHYTFLKRPVFVVNHKIFVGNTKKTIESLKQEIGQ